ncbi:MAG TPA: isoprenylcysteine carboxylmethyltransferase family protein [Candidatus Bipolaricaulota bacterium]|nr:isoprenylcysteine carboxylmethyltransferase family protein [Candidatus Bipolaricaulota bacterium]
MKIKIFTQIFFKVLAAVFFVIFLNPLLAGRWNYWQGWLFSVAMILMMIIELILFRDKLDLAKERMNPGPGVKWWDKILFPAFSLFTLAAWVVGVLDTGRFGLSAAWPIRAYVISWLVFIFSIFMFTWPMLENKWFSSVVRLQKDRGQLVCMTGPYKYVRHPGYVGGILMALSLGAIFGSLWALIPGGLAAIFLIIRTYLEDKTLKKELPGYLEYSKKVKYRLIPKIW